MKKIKLFIIILLILFLGIIIIFEFFGFEKKESDYFILKKGENILQVSNNLKQENYINSKILFLINSFQDKRFLKLKPGKYYLENNLDNDKILNILVKGVNVKEYITIIPGFDIEDVKYEMKKKGLLFVDNDYSSDFDFLEGSNEIEGYLFPDTYEIDFNKGGEYFIKQVLDNFNNKLDLSLREEIKKQDKTIFDIIKMASILEKEVISFEDKKKVAGILWKRLDSNMLLEVDSTYLYLNNWGDKNSNSLYNTYRYSGLPIGPICNPGLDSVKAAIFPIKTSYWFYLSKENGDTVFSKTYQEHLINKYKYIK